MAWLGLLVVLTLAIGAASARSATRENCGKAVVYDWYGDGRVDKIFPLHCYDDAIRSLPVDVLDYSNAKEDILRALAYAKKGEPDPGDAGSGGGGGGGGNGKGGGNGGGGGTTDTIDSTVETNADGGDVDTSGPSSIPIPLLVLGGLALLLLAAGGAGYLNRRRSGGDDEPGAAA